MRVQRLFIHPIKSLRPVEVQAAVVTETGLKFDRQFVLIDESQISDENVAQHLTIKTMSELCLFHQYINEEQTTLTVTYQLSDHRESLDVPLFTDPSIDSLNEKLYTIEIFGTRASCRDTSPKNAAFFSRHLHRPVRLLKILDNTYRNVPAKSLIPRRTITKQSKGILSSWLTRSETEEELHAQSQIHFADAAPLLITTTASEDDTRSRLPEEFQHEDIITKFRPNIHLDVSSETDVDHQIKPYAEDKWKTLHITSKSSLPTETTKPDPDSSPLEISLVFRTVRCQSLNVDYETGKLVSKERQLYRLLAKDRRVNPVFPAKPCFGMYGFAMPVGRVIRVGDEVEVAETSA